jgi:hypothetical protein
MHSVIPLMTSCWHQAGNRAIPWHLRVLLVVAMENGDLSWYVCPRTKCILVINTLSYESNPLLNKKESAKSDPKTSTVPPMQ